MKQLTFLVALFCSSQSIKVNNQAENFLDLESYPQSQLNVTGKQFTQFDAKSAEIPWTLSDDDDIFKMIKNQSKMHQPANISSINWAAIPDSLVQQMKANNKMPKKGFKNQILSTGPWEPDHFRSYSQKYLPSGTEYKFFKQEQLEENVKMIDSELQKLGINGTYQSFKLLRPKAFRADLWRWMALWQYGGIYMDAKMAFNSPTNDWIDFNNDELVLCMSPSLHVNNAVMAMTQYHPYALMMIKHINEKVQNRYYQDPQFAFNDLNITGPEAMRFEFIQDHALSYYNVRCYQNKDTKTNKWYSYQANDSSKVLAISDPLNDDTYMKMKTCPTCNDYKLLQQAHQVYCDEPGPDCDGKSFTEFKDENTYKHQWFKFMLENKTQSNQSSSSSKLNSTNSSSLTKQKKHNWDEFNKSSASLQKEQNKQPNSTNSSMIKKNNQSELIKNKTLQMRERSNAYDKALFNKYATERNNTRQDLSKKIFEKVDQHQIQKTEEDKAAKELAKKLIQNAEHKAEAKKAQEIAEKEFRSQQAVEKREQESKQRKLEEKHAREKEEIDQKQYEDAVKNAHLLGQLKRSSKKVEIDQKQYEDALKNAHDLGQKNMDSFLSRR